MPSSLEDKMQTWLQRAKDAATASVLQPTIAGYWPADCLLAKEAKADCFCLSFPPPPKDEIPQFCGYMAMQLHYHNAQTYIYLSTMMIAREGKPSPALGVFGSNRAMKLFWITPYVRGITGEITFLDTLSVDPSQVGPFGDLFLDETSIRPGLGESLKDLYTSLIRLPSEKLSSVLPIEEFFRSKQQSNPFPGMLPEEALSICSTFLKSRQSEPLPESLILPVSGKA